MRHEILAARADQTRKKQVVDLTIDGEGPSYTLTVHSAPFSDLHCAAENLFDLITEFRKSLESRGWRLLCKASRPDVAVSSAYRNQHGGGENVYLLTLGQPATSKNMVNIFSPADFEETGSVVEQQEFYRKWITSLN